jgi:uncharacterized membrane protein YhaH (DUF805 family)
MASYPSLLVSNIRGLARFSGRASQGQFWPYALTVFGAVMVAWAAIFVPFMTETMNRMATFAAAHPELSTVQTSPTSYSVSIQGDHPELMPDMSGVLRGLGVLAILTVALLAAAVTRRLHDRGRRGFWGLMPLPFIAFSVVNMGKLFAQFGGAGAPDMGLFFAVFFSNMLYLIGLVCLTVLLIRKGVVGPNAFGPDPKAAEQN